MTENKCIICGNEIEEYSFLGGNIGHTCDTCAIIFML